jgi:uncharacterized repeat protein (TIGR03803 family)
MTSKGGANGGGTIFKIKADGTGFTVVKSFNPSTNGAYPQGSLIEGSNGYLYGTTSGGGANGGGILFKIAPNGKGFTVLKKLISSTDGASPQGDLVEGSDGYMYGITSKGGANGGGTIFKIKADGTGFTVVKSFNPTTDGAQPRGSLIIQKGNKPTSPALQINFQDKYSKTPSGWVKDYGLPFGEKTIADSTLAYGWKSKAEDTPVDLSVGGPFPGNGRWRPAPSDVLLATLMHMQGDDVKNFRGTPVESYWEMAVENGDYQVSVSVGDGMSYTSTDPESHSINVEGIPLITHFIPTGANGASTRFKQASIKVTVTDGFLTLDADGGTNTKINYAIFQPLPTSTKEAVAKQAAFLVEPVEKQSLKAYPIPFQDKLSIDMAGQSGKLTITVVDLAGKSFYQAVEQVQKGVVTLDLSAAGLQAGVYFIKLQSEDGSGKAVRVVKR